MMTVQDSSGGCAVAGIVTGFKQLPFTKTAGGIIIPDSAKENPCSKVMLVGIAKKDEQLKLKLAIPFLW